jgi:hypothetical protein
MNFVPLLVGLISMGLTATAVVVYLRRWLPAQVYATSTYTWVRGGFAAAQVLGVLAFLNGGLTTWSDLWWVGGSLVVSTGLAVFFGLLYFDRLVLGSRYRAPVRQFLRGLATEAVEIAGIRSAVLVAIGIITYGACTGYSDLGVFGSVMATLVLLVAAFLVGIVGIRVLAPRLSGVDLRAQLFSNDEKMRITASRTYIGCVLAVGIIMGSSAQGTLHSFTEVLLRTGVGAVASLLVTLLIARGVDGVLMPGRHSIRTAHRQGNVNDATLAAIFLVIFAALATPLGAEFAALFF